MKKFLDIKGLSVSDVNGSTRGIVEDGVIDFKNNKICSLIVSRKSIIAAYSLLSIKNIRSFGNVVMASDEIYRLNKSVVKKNRGSMIARFLGKEVVGTDGNIVGNLADVIFDESTGQIKALLCTKGLIEDIFQGRKLIIVDGKTIFCDERIIVGEDGPDITNDASFKKFIT